MSSNMIVLAANLVLSALDENYLCTSITVDRNVSNSFDTGKVT